MMNDYDGHKKKKIELHKNLIHSTKYQHKCSSALKIERLSGLCIAGRCSVVWGQTSAVVSKALSGITGSLIRSHLAIWPIQQDELASRVEAVSVRELIGYAPRCVSGFTHSV